jgi:glycosyltransferase involved in cell wall biosynthesis
VLFLITDLSFGGTPRSVQALAVGLQDRGYPVRVVSLFSGGEVADELRAARVLTSGLGIERRRIGAVWSLFRLLRRERPLILHAFLFHANLLGRFAGRLARVPFVVASERSVEPGKKRVRVLIDRWTWRLATLWTANADAVAGVLSRREGIDRGRIVVIPTAVDAERFSPGAASVEIRARLGVGAGEPLLVAVGRLDKLKGYDTLVDAFRIVGSRRRDVRLVIVGEGPERRAIEARVAGAGLADSVHLVGAAGDVVSYLRAADLFVLASDTEGMPGAALEAMAVGLPVVATAVGGTPEVIVDGETGLLVAPGDPAALASAVIRLLDRRDLAARLGRSARERVVERYSISRALDLTEAMYAGLIDSCERGSALRAAKP